MIVNKCRYCGHDRLPKEVTSLMGAKYCQCSDLCSYCGKVLDNWYEGCISCDECRKVDFKSKCSICSKQLDHWYVGGVWCSECTMKYNK